MVVPNFPVINDADGAGPGEAVRTNTVFDGDNAWADYNEAGEAIARYLFGDTIDSNIARWRSGEGTAWYLTDHLGTVRALAGAVGTIVNQTTYDSFGQVLNETNALFGDRFKFTGRELNSGSADYYYRARAYNAIQGRFGSLDPIGFEGNDTNLTRYVGNSSLNAVDPSGEIGATIASALFIAFVASIIVVVACDDGRLGGEGLLNGNENFVGLCNLTNNTFQNLADYIVVNVTTPPPPVPD